MKKLNPEALKTVRTVICIVLVAMYFVGLVFLMTGLFYAGIVLWAISTIGGMGLLYYIRTTERTEKAVREGLKEESELEKNGNAEASDDTCE